MNKYLYTLICTYPQAFGSILAFFGPKLSFYKYLAHHTFWIHFVFLSPTSIVGLEFTLREELALE
jgi:hypothetical protein